MLTPSWSDATSKKGSTCLFADLFKVVLRIVRSETLRAFLLKRTMQNKIKVLLYLYE